MAALHFELGSYLEALVSGMPGHSGQSLREAYYRRRLKKLGVDAWLGPGLLIIGAENIAIGDQFHCQRMCMFAACDDGIIEIGDRVNVNAGVHLNACVRGRITIGDDVLIGPNVLFRTSDHVFDDPSIPIVTQGHSAGEICVEADVWLGANVTVVGGVRIGQGAVVAAGAVVTRDVDPLAVVAGVPARLIRRRGQAVP